jgi:hypothetical protein
MISTTPADRLSNSKTLITFVDRNSLTRESATFSTLLLGKSPIVAACGAENRESEFKIATPKELWGIFAPLLLFYGSDGGAIWRGIRESSPKDEVSPGCVGLDGCFRT